MKPKILTTRMSSCILDFEYNDLMNGTMHKNHDIVAPVKVYTAKEKAKLQQDLFEKHGKWLGPKVVLNRDYLNYDKMLEEQDNAGEAYPDRTKSLNQYNVLKSMRDYFDKSNWGRHKTS